MAESRRVALVTGASRGFGRAVAIALAGAGARVVGVARDQSRLAGLQAELGDRLTPVAAEIAGLPGAPECPTGSSARSASGYPAA